MSSSIERNAPDPHARGSGPAPIVGRYRTSGEVGVDLGPEALRDLVQPGVDERPSLLASYPANAAPLTPRSGPSTTASERRPLWRSRQLLQWALPGFAVLLTGGLVAGTLHRALVIDPAPPRAAATMRSGTIYVPPAPSVASVSQTVKFANPFDHAEIFEFPSGTSREEARAQVADMLLKRAQDRLLQFAHRPRMGRHTTASATLLPKPAS